MEAAAWPSSQRRRASGSSGGGGGACIGDLPDALLSRIFESIEWSHRYASSIGMHLVVRGGCTCIRIPFLHFFPLLQGKRCISEPALAPRAV